MSEFYPGLKPLIDPPLEESGEPLMGNPILMRAASRNKGSAASGPVVWTAGVLLVLATIAIGAFYWVFDTSQPPLFASATAPPAAVGAAPIVPATAPAAAPTPTAPAATTIAQPEPIAPPAMRPSVLAGSEHRAAVRREIPKARAAAEVGSDLSATVTAALTPQVAPSASSPPAATPSVPAVVTPPATPGPEAP